MSNKKCEITFIEDGDKVKAQCKVENLSLIDHVHVMKLIADTFIEHATDFINKQKQVQNVG